MFFRPRKALHDKTPNHVENIIREDDSKFIYIYI